MQHLLQRAVARIRANASGLLRSRRAEAQQQQASLERAEQLFEAGDYQGAAAILENAGKDKKRAWRILLQCYLRTHRFDDLVSTYETMPAEVRKDVTCRTLYVTAAANLRRSDLIETVVDHVLNEPDKAPARS